MGRTFSNEEIADYLRLVKKKEARHGNPKHWLAREEHIHRTPADDAFLIASERWKNENGIRFMTRLCIRDFVLDYYY